MYSDLDDDFPLNGGSEKLDRLFEENALPDISFKFTGPKATVPRPKPSPNIIPLKVVFAKTVETFQMKVGGYKSEGKVGIAIIGNDENCYYQLYMYRSDEKKVTSAEITFNFGFLVQQHNYASFKDSHEIQWSVHFDKPEDLTQFSKEIALARWRTCQGSKKKLVQGAFKGNPDIVVKSSDIIRVSYNVCSISPENIIHEEENLKRTRMGPAKSSVWETNLVGSCIGCRKLIILPPHQVSNMPEISLPEGYHILLDVEVLEVVTPPQLPPDLSSSFNAPTHQHEVETQEEKVSNLPGRMAKIGHALPTFQPHEPPADLAPSISKTITSQNTPCASVLSLQSTTSSSPHPNPPSLVVDSSDLGTTSQFNVLFSEVRTHNTELRLNISRVNDKMDSLISKMDFIPKINYELMPAVHKFQSLDTVLNKIVEQNTSMIALLDRNSPAQLESLVQENLQLKKRNAELESFLDVSRSTTEILKAKVGELLEKNLLLERDKGTPGRCDYCQGGEGEKKIHSLEESMQSLQDRNYSLLETSELLQRQNQQLGSQLSSLQREIAMKDLRIAEAEKEINSSSSIGINSEGMDKKIERILKSLLNKIYRSLKEELKNSDPGRLDYILSRVLKESVQGYLNTGDGPLQYPSPMEDTPFSEGREAGDEIRQTSPPGKTPFSPSETPLPVPRPRRPAPSPQPPSSPSAKLPTILEKPSESSDPEDQPLHLEGKLTHAEESSKEDSLVTDVPKPDSLTSINSTTNESESKSESPPDSPYNPIPSTFNPYSSAYYSPYIPNKPPPIDDGSDL